MDSSTRVFLSRNNFNEQDRDRVSRANWPSIHNRGQDTYMHAVDQEWILQLESSYPEIIFPPGLEHVDLTVTCGELLQAHALNGN